MDNLGLKLGNRTFLATEGERKTWREAVLERDNYTCQICGVNYSDCSCLLHAHHIKPVSLFPELALDIDNGEARCHLCHNRGISIMTKEEQFIHDVNILTRHGVAALGDAYFVREVINRLEREEQYAKNSW